MQYTLADHTKVHIFKYLPGTVTFLTDQEI